MTDQGPPCVVCKAEMVYVGQIMKKGHPQDGRHLYQRYEGAVRSPSPVYEI